MRASLFDTEPVAGLGGLKGLTAPSAKEPLAAVVDVVVVGAKSDGKTQFITHFLRTMDAAPAPDISPEEEAQNEKIFQLVMNAKMPLPEANPDRRVRHYVYRMKPEKLLAGMSIPERLANLWRSRVGRLYMTCAAAAGPIVAVALWLWRGTFDLRAVLGGALALLGGMLWAYLSARRDFLGLGEVEVVLWDVAGEDVYSDRGAGLYHSFLQNLVRARATLAKLYGRPYTLAPVLICNPVSLGTVEKDSPYARLRMIMPNFAALVRPRAEVLVVVNRWELVKVLCGPDGEVDDGVAVVPIARDASAGSEGPRPPLPVVRRQVVHRHCRDGEPAVVGDTRFRMLHYDAGLHTEVSEKPWTGFDALSDEVKARFSEPGALPDGVTLKALAEYRYAEGPGVLEGEARHDLFGWLARLVWPWGEMQGNVPQAVSTGASGPVQALASSPSAPLEGAPVVPRAAIAPAAAARGKTSRLAEPAITTPDDDHDPDEPAPGGTKKMFHFEPKRPLEPAAASHLLRRAPPPGQSPDGAPPGTVTEPAPDEPSGGFRRGT